MIVDSTGDTNPVSSFEHLFAFSSYLWYNMHHSFLPCGRSAVLTNPRRMYQNTCRLLYQYHVPKPSSVVPKTVVPVPKLGSVVPKISAVAVPKTVVPVPKLSSVVPKSWYIDHTAVPLVPEIVSVQVVGRRVGAGRPAQERCTASARNGRKGCCCC